MVEGRGGRGWAEILRTVLLVDGGAERVGVGGGVEGAGAAREQVPHHKRPLKHHPLVRSKPLQRRHCTPARPLQLSMHALSSITSLSSKYPPSMSMFRLACERQQRRARRKSCHLHCRRALSMPSNPVDTAATASQLAAIDDAPLQRPPGKGGGGGKFIVCLDVHRMVFSRDNVNLKEV